MQRTRVLENFCRFSRPFGRLDRSLGQIAKTTPISKYRRDIILGAGSGYVYEVVKASANEAYTLKSLEEEEVSFYNYLFTGSDVSCYST